MKSLKHYLILICILILNADLHSQTPQSIPYQAVARNSAGELLISQPVSIRLRIRDLNSSGTILYSETHSVTTNSQGLFTVNIGTGTVVSGAFANINWSTGNKFLQVEMDAAGGTNFLNMGTQQLLSVPYSLYSANSYYELLQTKVANASSSIDFTGLNSSYYAYKVIFSDVKVPDASALRIRMSTTNGLTYLTAGYEYSTYGYNSAGTFVTNFNTNGGEIALTASDNLEVSPIGNLSGEITIYYPANTANPSGKMVSGQIVYGANTGRLTNVSCGGCNKSATGLANPINAVRFLSNLGSIAGGTFKLYGIRGN